MVTAFGWQSIVYLNVPIGVIAFIVAFWVVPESKSPEKRGLDIPGQLLAVAGLTALAFAFIEANNYGRRSAVMISLFAVAAVTLVLFGLRERRAKSPVLKMHFFKDITFIGANLVGIMISFGFIGMLMFLALFMQNVQGFTAVQAGVRQLPSTLAVMVVSIISGRIVSRIGARAPSSIGMLIVGAGVLSFLTVQSDTPYSHYWWILAVVGVGTGLVMSPITTPVMSTVPVARAGMASATTNTMCHVGVVFGIAVLGSILTTRLLSAGIRGLVSLGLSPSVAEQIMTKALEGDTSGGGGVPSISSLDTNAIGTTINDSFMAGFRRAVLVAGVVLLAAAVVGAVMIRNTSPEAQLVRMAAQRSKGEAEAAAIPACPAAEASTPTD